MHWESDGGGGSGVSGGTASVRVVGRGVRTARYAQGDVGQGELLAANECTAVTEDLHPSRRTHRPAEGA